MKVLFINSFYYPDIGGGAERTLQLLVEGLAQTGTEAVVLATTDKPGLKRDEINGVPVWRAGLRNLYWHHRMRPASPLVRRAWHAIDVNNPLMGSYVSKVLELENPDAVSCHNLPGWSIAAWSRLIQHNIPFLQVLHDAYLICPRSTMFRTGRFCSQQCFQCRLMRLPHRSLSRRARAVVGVSEFILAAHTSLGYFKDVPIQKVIHNARNETQLGSLGAPIAQGVPLRFGYIGSLSPVKGVRLLLDVFRSKRPRGSELWLAGSGDKTYEGFLVSEFASSEIRFLGQTPPRDFYPHVDVVIVPSVSQEPLGMVVAEAFAFGRPVIGARRGGIPEMIEDGINGFLFEPNRPDELAAAMNRLAGDPSLSARMGTEARASAKRFLDTERFISSYRSVYEELVGHDVQLTE